MRLYKIIPLVASVALVAGCTEQPTALDDVEAPQLGEAVGNPWMEETVDLISVQPLACFNGGAGDLVEIHLKYSFRYKTTTAPSGNVHYVEKIVGTNESTGVSLDTGYPYGVQGHWVNNVSSHVLQEGVVRQTTRSQYLVNEGTGERGHVQFTWHLTVNPNNTVSFFMGGLTCK